MRGLNSAGLPEEELSRVLREILGRFAREAAELNLVADCLEDAVTTLAGNDPIVELVALTDAIKAGAVNAGALMVTLQLRLASLEGIASALAAILKAPEVASRRR